MKNRKGQVIVEFALILPFLLLLIFGSIDSGMLFHDYSTLSNIARSSSREAAISTSSDYPTIADRYEGLLDNLMTGLYAKDKTHPIVIEDVTVSGENSVRTIIQMNLTVRNYFIDLVLPSTFGVQYYMRKEP